MILNYGEKSGVSVPGINPTSESSSFPILPAGAHGRPAPTSGQLSGRRQFCRQPVHAVQLYRRAGGCHVAGLLSGWHCGGKRSSTRRANRFRSNGFAPFGGTVTITDITGATPVVLGSGPLDGSATGCPCVFVQATFATAGHHLLRLSYTGDANVKGLTATPFVDVAANAPSSVTLSADLPNAPAGTAVTLTASVSNSDVRQHPATGTVTFLDGATSIGTAVLDSNGNATLVTKALSGGIHNLTASYPGDSVLTPSVSTPITETISDYIFQALPATLTIQEGQTGTAALNIIPLGGFSQAVQVSCGTLPANVSCTFSPTTATPDGTHPSAIVLTIKAGSAVAGNVEYNGSWAATSTIGLAGMLLPFGWRRRRRIKTMVVVLGLMFVGLYVGGCSSGGSSQSGGGAGSFKINVAATTGAGATPKTASMTVNIIK